MKFTIATIAASAAALVSASPVASTPSTEIKAGDVFSIMAIRSGSEIQYSSLQAINNSFVLNVANQNATCSEDVNYASFQLNDAGELYLYGANPPQQAYVSRSGMGQGVFAYTTGDQNPRNIERTKFAIEDGNFVFKDYFNEAIGLQACPNSWSSGYSIWLDSNKNPGGTENCVGFIARAVKEENQISCSYSALL